MKDLERPAPWKLKEYIMKSFQKSEKRHLLITGSRGIGKTTLLGEILKGKSNIGGIKTYVEIGQDGLPKKVILEDMIDREINVTIGKRYDRSMESVLEGFEKTGLEILKKNEESPNPTLVIDEIGFLETKAINYQEQIFRLLDKKEMILVLRKEDNPFINRIKDREDVFLVDLDEVIV